MSLIFNAFTGNFDSVSDLTVSVGSTPNSNASTVTTTGASLNLVLQPADGSNPGLVSTTSQTIAGAKTFSTPPILSSLTASLPLQLDASKNIVASAIDLSGTQATGTLASGRFPALLGDVTTSAGALTTTLATVNANVGSFTNAAITVNAKGLITAASSGTTGNLTDAGTDGIVITGGTGAVLGTGTSIAQHVADTTHNGYLSSTDWNTFNSKQAAGNYITVLTGDATASGPGSAALTLATVNANVGSFTNASVTVNAKGLITAVSNGTTGNLTDAGTDGITVTGGTGAVLGSGTSISQHVSDSTHNGYLASADWSTFNGKANASLNNLSSVAINTSLVPGTDSSINLGSTLKRYTSAFVDALTFDNVSALNMSTLRMFDTAGFGLAHFNDRQLYGTDGATVRLDWALSKLVSGATTKLDWSGTNLDINTRKIVNVTDPTSAQDAATKAYVDAAAGTTTGDISLTSFNAAASQTNATLTGLAFANATVRGFKCLLTVTTTSNLYETFELVGIQRAADWQLAYTSMGDVSGYTFTINSSGQVLYSSPSTTAKIEFRAQVTQV